MDMKEKEKQTLEDLKGTQAFACAKAFNNVDTPDEANDLIKHFMETKQIKSHLVVDDSILLMLNDCSLLMIIKDGESRKIIPMDCGGILKILYHYFPYEDIGTLNASNYCG